MVPLLQFLLCAGFDDECGSPGEVQPLDQSMPLGREFLSIHWDGWASHIPNVMEVLRSSVPRSLFPFSWIAIRCRQIMICICQVMPECSMCILYIVVDAGIQVQNVYHSRRSVLQTESYNLPKKWHEWIWDRFALQPRQKPGTLDTW